MAPLIRFRHLLPRRGEGDGAEARERGVTEHRASPRLKGFARDLRKAATPHEDRLWYLLRGRRFLGYRFRRQVPIGSYIADFVCYGRRLIVELDGSQHADDAEYDQQRDAELEARGFRIVRVWNSNLSDNEDSVLEAILAALRGD